MFWGMICGRQKGPCYVFPKDIGVNASNYQDLILPLVKDFLGQQQQLRNPILFIHNGAPTHRADLTQAWLQEMIS